MPDIAIITPVLPGTHDWLRDLAQSVRLTREHHPELDLKWLVIWDGPGDHADVDSHLQATGAIVLTQAEHRGEGSARNLALYSSHLDDTDFIVPMDADDLLVPDGLARTVADLAAAGYDWAAANRTLLRGDYTPHWHGARTWSRGEVANTWSSPLAFHPNSIVVTTELARHVGGWPTLPTNADLLFAMLCSEAAEGISVPHVLTRYRVWDRQVTNQDSYLAQKAAAFTHIAETINAARGQAGETITAPAPCHAPRTATDATPPLERWTMDRAWRHATEHGDLYLAAGLITATRLDRSYSWETSHGSPLAGKKGDWHARNEIDEWTIDGDIFAQTYTHVTGDSYRKHVPVSAVQILEPFICETLEGDVLAPAGDWLIASTTQQDAWPVRALAFWDRYPDGPQSTVEAVRSA